MKTRKEVVQMYELYNGRRCAVTVMRKVKTREHGIIDQEYTHIGRIRMNELQLSMNPLDAIDVEILRDNGAHAKVVAIDIREIVSESMYKKRKAERDSMLAMKREKFLSDTQPPQERTSP